MSNEEMDRAIAEAVGWKLVNVPGYFFNGIQVQMWHDPTGKRGSAHPRYSTDLNAMHEAEKTLTDHWDGFNFRNHLCNNIHATAVQRAEAFLRTIGKWREA